ncbi:MAG: PHP domain-containing protein [Clostridia bacterium]|nr:PHP domain-containing protein [Clostridia bacterium]
MKDGLYLTETHCHTSAGSACGKISPEEQVDCYKSLGYDTIFITEHFPISIKFGMSDCPYEEQVAKMLSGFQLARARGDRVGLRVLFAFEFGFRGSDTLTYGLDPAFLYDHPEIVGMDPVAFAELAHSKGAFLIHAHPFREASYIKLIRLYPRSVDAVEVFNACRTDEVNARALQYAVSYGLPFSSGSDNHRGIMSRYGGLLTKDPIESSEDLAHAVLTGTAKLYQTQRVAPA